MKYTQYLLRYLPLVLLLSGLVQAKEKSLNIYLDADFSNNQASAVAIKQGIMTALDEINYEIQGYQIKLVEKDHRANVARSKNNLQYFLKDKQALLVFGGMHSPPLIKNLPFIHEHGILTLVPWAAGGPITRYQADNNWVFRLSIDDANAGFKLVEYAIENKKCKLPYLVLENTSWGDSNFKTLTTALKQRNVHFGGVSRFGWDLKDMSAKQIARKIKSIRSDCVFLVSNVLEGETMSRALIQELGDNQIKMISHWGITGADFAHRIKFSQRSALDLAFIQTCFSFNSKNGLSSLGENVLERAKKLFPNQIQTAHDINPPAGFIHAYDLTKLMISAAQQVKLSKDMAQNRDRIRRALEQMNNPVKGLIKTYHRPFATFDNKNGVGHDALGLNDYCIGKYNKDNKIILIE